MNIWLTGSAVLLFALAPCAVATFRGNTVERLIGLEMAGMISTLLLVMLAEGTHRANFYDLALTLALLSFGGGLVFARFLERWL
jgi:multisubunit Na+/H+ antiporter MnhF subunit